MPANVSCYSDPATIAFCTVVSINWESTRLKNLWHLLMSLPLRSMSVISYY